MKPVSNRVTLIIHADNSGEIEQSDDQGVFEEKYGELGTLGVYLWRSTGGVAIADLTEDEDRDTPNLAAVPEEELKGRPIDVATW